MKIGSLCTGYGGLDMAVEAYFKAETIWCAEYDKYACKLIEHRFDFPNYKDITKINWNDVEPIDILTAGYPCQPFSLAGLRQGSNDARHLWPYIKEGISVLRPKWVVLENVRGHLSLGFKEVLKDLAEVGYDARWEIVRASDVGAPHQRARLFIIAYPTSLGLTSGITVGSKPPISTIKNDGHAANSHSNARQESRRAITCLCSKSEGLRNGQDERQARDEHRFSFEMDRQTIPNTLDEGKLNPAFVEYMMGLPPGWVSDIDMLRSQKLKMLGNGVVPQQAYYAIKTICDALHIPHSEIIGDATHE